MVMVANCCNFQIFFLGQSYFNDNNSYALIKAEVPERMMELNNHTVSIPCPICGMGETGTHNHYGGRACTSCRAFFRRSVQTNSYKVPHNCHFICNIILFHLMETTIHYTIPHLVFII